MTIEITQPDLEAIIEQRLNTGAFKDAEDVILQALRSVPISPQQAATPVTKDLVELFAPLRGMNLEFSRNPSSGRPVDI